MLLRLQVGIVYNGDHKTHPWSSVRMILDSGTPLVFTSNRVKTKQ